MSNLKRYQTIAEGWSGLDFPPQADAGWTSLARELQENSKSEFHAKRIVKEWCSEFQHCPKPCEIKDFARKIPADPEIDPHAPLPDPCEECSPYSGNWRMVIVKITHMGEEQEIQALERCICPRGQALRLRDQIGKAERAKEKPKKMKRVSSKDTSMAAANDKEEAEIPW